MCQTTGLRHSSYLTAGTDSPTSAGLAGSRGRGGRRRAGLEGRVGLRLSLHGLGDKFGKFPIYRWGSLWQIK